jgi:hypothetical protein
VFTAESSLASATEKPTSYQNLQHYDTAPRNIEAIGINGVGKIMALGNCAIGMILRRESQDFLYNKKRLSLFLESWPALPETHQ